MRVNLPHRRCGETLELLKMQHFREFSSTDSTEESKKAKFEKVYLRDDGTLQLL